MSVKVTNTGSFTGRKAVTLFIKAPAGKLSKPSRVLIGFDKTGEIAPGESQTMTAGQVLEQVLSSIRASMSYTSEAMSVRLMRSEDSP